MHSQHISIFRANQNKPVLQVVYETLDYTYDFFDKMPFFYFYQK